MLVAVLNSPGPAPNDKLGWLVAISGTWVVAWSPGGDTGTSNTGSEVPGEPDGGSVGGSDDIYNGGSKERADGDGPRSADRGAVLPHGDYPAVGNWRLAMV